jgi:F-box/leucine-rich repeat protein 7
MPLDLLDRLRTFPLFSTAPSAFLESVALHLRPQIHMPHTHILTEGSDAKAMYWLVRGVVAVCSKDGEATYAELRPGAFFGEIGVLMGVPRTADVVARSKCLVVVLRREDLEGVLKGWPEVERRIREEAEERLSVLRKKKEESERGKGRDEKVVRGAMGGTGVSRELEPGLVGVGEQGRLDGGGRVVNLKKRKSPSPGIMEDPAAGSALGSGLVNIRTTLRELPLFQRLPPDILHFLGLAATPKTYPPFKEIIRQGSLGNEIFFIVRGEAEVIHLQEDENGRLRETWVQPNKRPRLRQGQYFGEVASLKMAPRRTATVRAVTTVECLMISGETLEELWRRCSPDIRRQVEATARQRYKRRNGEVEDTVMTDSEDEAPKEGMRSLNLADTSPRTRRSELPQVTFTPSRPITPEPEQEPTSDSQDDKSDPSDPDPFLSVDLDNMRTRMGGRRHSWAPPIPQDPTSSPPLQPFQSSQSSPIHCPSRTATPPANDYPYAPHPHTITPPAEDDHDIRSKRPRHVGFASSAFRWADPFRKTVELDEDILVKIFADLDIGQLMRVSSVSRRWRQIARTHPELCRVVNLSLYNRRITNAALISSIIPFIGERPQSIDISNCFHITDIGFSALVKGCGRNVRVWRMKSVWDIAPGSILELGQVAGGLREVDLSNCRKVSDALLARVVGWVVQEPREGQGQGQGQGQGGGQAQGEGQTQLAMRPRQPSHDTGSGASTANGTTPNGLSSSPTIAITKSQHPEAAPTIIGCPQLSHLTLSYCKHLTDRTMAHLAAHAAHRLVSLDLTRCTSITDAGFTTWGHYRFARLERLVLADCTYLGDAAIVGLVSACGVGSEGGGVSGRGGGCLKELDLSFCCALSDTSTEVLALGLPGLRVLKMAFCGSAVSDASLRSVGLHLAELRELSVRGCVRVTGLGVDAVVKGCAELERLDVSQCRSLGGWLAKGGRERTEAAVRRAGMGLVGEGGRRGRVTGRRLEIVVEKEGLGLR